MQAVVDYGIRYESDVVFIHYTLFCLVGKIATENVIVTDTTCEKQATSDLL